MGTIRRKGYYATRKGNKYYVRPSTMVDRGERGKWTSIHKTRGIGPLQKGTLLGYNASSKAATRRITLKRVVHKHGPLSTFRKLNAVAVYTKRTSPTRSKTFRTDRNWVKKNFM
jgi:hypothetical protein